MKLVSVFVLFCCLLILHSARLAGREWGLWERFLHPVTGARQKRMDGGNNQWGM